MTIKERKNEFIQKFLKIQNEDIILRIERFMEMEKRAVDSPMSKKELNSRIDKSEEDFKNNKFTTQAELLKKYQ